MKEPIRILHVFGLLERGGAESMIMDLYRNIDRKLIQFDFIKHTKEVHSFEKEIKSLGGRIYSIPKFNGINYLEYVNSWKDFFKNHSEYLIVHGHMNSTASIYLKIAKRYGLITIAHSHSTSSGSGIIAESKNLLRYPIRNIADYLLSCSIDAGQWLFGSNVKVKDNFYLLNNAIQTEKFVFNKKMRIRKREELNITDETVIGHVGNFGYPKNHNYLIDIFNEYHKLNSNSILLLIGDGSLKREIVKKVSKYNLDDHVKFLGRRFDINELLQAMDVFVMPSIYEGLPVSLIEAQAAGLPTIASSTITNEVKITDLVAFISLKQTPEDWAEQINKYSIKYQRKDMSKEIKRAGYDVRTTAKWLEEFYLKKSNEHQMNN